MKCYQSRSGFELVSPCSFPTTITVTPWAPPSYIYTMGTTIVHLPLFWITFCHLLDSLLIPLKQKSAGFQLKKFSTNVFTWSWRNFFFAIQSILYRTKKDGNYLVHGLMIMIDKVEQTSLNLTFFQHDSCWMWPYILMEKYNISPIDKCGVFS